MVAKKVSNTKPTGVNKAIQEGINTEEFKSRVICKKCGKDIEFTLGSELFLECPRCGKKVERDLKAENKEADQIIKFDILKRSKKYSLQIGFGLTLAALAYNIIGFFANLFAEGRWWLALMSLPIVFISYCCMRVTRLKSASKKYRVFAWLALCVNTLALVAIIVTAIPDVNAWLLEMYNKNT